LPVRFFSITNNFKLKSTLKIKRWIYSTFHSEGIQKKIDLNIIFCTDDELLNINNDYLGHNFYTDIITFPIEESENYLEAELYVSIDRVEDNASLLEVPFQDELQRVIIHGVLHLAGYSDKTKTQELIMREKESYYISLL
jgi:probable rRNA maturation factor